MSIPALIDFTMVVTALCCFITSCIVSDEIDTWFKLGTICLLLGMIAGSFA